MNTRLLRKVAKHIAEEPKRFIMGHVVQNKLDASDKVYESEFVAGRDHWNFPECGTAACIAGWSAILAKKKHVTWASGRTALQISTGQASRLFAATCWPERFRDGFENGKSPRARVRIAVARIEHFIKTKGAE